MGKRRTNLGNTRAVYFLLHPVHKVFFCDLNKISCALLVILTAITIILLPGRPRGGQNDIKNFLLGALGRPLASKGKQKPDYEAPKNTQMTSPTVPPGGPLPGGTVDGQTGTQQRSPKWSPGPPRRAPGHPKGRQSAQKAPPGTRIGHLLKLCFGLFVVFGPGWLL